ncbi:MAG: SDR family oxidoreductase [Nanoarchaeota archaeon]
MKILVTGGAGYLGQLLTRRLVDSKHEVIVLDNFLFNLRNKLPSGIKIIRNDIRNMTALIKGIKQSDAVIHLASIVGEQAAGLDPNETVQVNFMATRNLAELCKMYNKKLFFASTCSVYGDKGSQMKEEDEITLDTPVELYGKTKLMSENAIKEILDNHCILRLATLFGYSPRMRFDLVVNLFIGKAIEKEKLVVFGGNQWRPFLHVDDAARAFQMAVENNWKGTVNVSHTNIMIKDVGKLIAKKLGAEIIYSTNIIDKRNYFVETEKMKTLKFFTEKTIDDAIKEIDKAYEEREIIDYKNPKYHNHKAITYSDEIKKKVYTQGVIQENKNG